MKKLKYIIKFRFKTTLTVFMLAVVAIVFLPKYLNNYYGRDIKAGPLEIEKSSDEKYFYEFSASSFKLYMGEIEGNANLLVTQGGRKLDITVNDTIRDSMDDIDTQASTSAILDEQDIENAEIQLIDTATESGVYYKRGGVKVTPRLDGIDLSLQSTDSDIPTLTINPLGLEGFTGEDDIQFRTKTNRKAYSFGNAIITDANGESTDVNILLKGHVEMDPSISGDVWYTIEFLPDATWLNDPNRRYPLMLSMDFTSHFYERMLPMRPVKRVFKSMEPLRFEIDTIFINNLDIQSDLLNGDFSKIRFGIIDTRSRQEELNVEFVEKFDDGRVIIELWPRQPIIKAGLFDLLMEYDGESVFISEQEFSWGVLTMNPDQSVYKTGDIARIDMAVLDKNGILVCDAKLSLSVTDPDGGVEHFSTDAGNIEVSPECINKVTALPDYSTVYQTKGDGLYEMRLIAETNEGVYQIDDEFRVDSNSAFYVKRIGPTRIWPLTEYEMVLEIESATGSADYQVQEVTPADFEIEGGKIEQVGQNSIISWQTEFTEGQVRTLTYTFDAPDISPAVFLLGSAKVVSLDGEIAFTEDRRWQIASDDVTGKLYPVADGTDQPSTWTLDGTGCNTATCWSAVEETTGATACTGDDNVDVGTGEELIGTAGSVTFDIDESSITAGSTVTDIAVTMCVNRTGTGANCAFDGRYCVSGSCSSSGAGNACPSSWTASTDTFSSLSITDLSDLEIGITYATGARNAHLARIRTTITFTPPAGGPTTDQLMRHGNWWDSGTEQGFFWAD